MSIPPIETYLANATELRNQLDNISSGRVEMSDEEIRDTITRGIKIRDEWNTIKGSLQMAQRKFFGLVSD